MAETAEERRRRLTNEMMKGTGVTADDLSEWLAYTDEEVKGKSKSDKKKEAQKKRIQKQRLASIEKGKKAAQKLAPDLVESTKKKRESWILPEGEEMTWKPTPDQLRAMEKKDREVAKYAPQFKKAVEESEETGVLGSRDHSLKYRGEAPKRDTGSPSFHPSDPGAREKISNQTFRKAAGDRIKRLRHERAIMQSRPRLEEGNERWHKRPDSEEIHERYMDMAGTEKQLGDEEMPGLMNLYETDRDSRIKRAAEYKQFSDDAKLSALERARRGEVPLQQGTTGGSLEDLAGEGSAAYTEMKEREHEKYGGIGRDALEQKHLRDKGLTGGSDLYRRKHGIGGLPPSVRARLESPEAAGTRIAPDDPYMKEIAGDPDAPGLKEWAASGAQATIEGDIEKGMAQDEEERAVNEEFTVQQNMQNMTEDEQNQVIQTVQDQMGPQSEQAIAAKEATGRYVRYEGSGFVINKSALEKAFDRKEKMAMLQHVPQEKRAGLLYNWGFIDPEDFNETQKKSAKELKELEVLDLQHKKLEKEMANITRKVDPEKKIQYEQAATGFRQAIKDENYDDAAMFADQMKELGMPMKGFNAQDLISKRDKKIANSTPKVLAIAKKYGLMVGGKPTLDPFYKQQTKLTEKLNFINKDAKPSDIAQLLGTPVTTQDGKSTTYGEIMERNRIPQWEVIQRRINAGGTAPQDVKLARLMGLDSLSQVTKPHYYGWAKKAMHEAISRDVWGDMYDEVKTETSKEYRKRKQAALDGINNPEIQEPEPPPPTTIEGGPIEGEPGSNMPPPPNVSGPVGPEPGGGGGSQPSVQTQEQEPPPASAETMENLQQQVEEEQIQEAFEEDVARPAKQQAAFKLWKEQNKPPKNKSQKAEYKRFTEYGIRLLEQASPERLEKMLAIFEKEKAKKKKAGGTHYYQDYNIAYINILLNK